VTKLLLLAALGAGLAAAGFWLSQPDHPDFSIYDALLRKYVDDDGRVDYRAWKAADRAELQRFLDQIATAWPSRYPREGQLAFWINAYNAFTIAKVLDAFPIPRANAVPHFFDGKGLRVAGRDMSLNDIEHGMVRRKFADPRAHAALVCAGRSCPRLLPHAYPADGLDAVLDAQMAEFVADPFRNRYEPAAGRAHLSDIFNGYRGDFEAAAGSLIGFVQRYAPDRLKTLLARPDLKVDFLVYDDSLNAR